MGSTSTKQEVQQPVEVETSNGFHLLEIHLPTAGMGILTFIFVACIVILLVRCYKRCASGQHHVWQHQAPPIHQPYQQPYNPWSPDIRPMIYFISSDGRLSHQPTPTGRFQDLDVDNTPSVQAPAPTTTADDDIA